MVAGMEWQGRTSSPRVAETVRAISSGQRTRPSSLAWGSRSCSWVSKSWGRLEIT